MAESAVPETSLSAGSEAVFDTECSPCSADGQHKEAVSYCRDCGEHLCDECVHYHKKVPSLKRHQLLDKDTVTTTQGTPKVLDTCTERCPDHKNEIIKLFCPDHNTTACVICMALNHKPCDRMEYIEDAAAGLADRQDYKEFTTRLEDLTQQSEDTVTLAMENKQRSSDCHTKTIQDLDAYEEELVNNVHRHIEAIRNQAGEIHAQDTDKMDKLASKGNKVLAELRVVATNVNNLKSKKHLCKLFVEMKQNEQTFKKLQKSLEATRDNKVTPYTFQRDEDMRAMIGRQDGLGKLVIRNTERGRPSSTSTSDMASGKQKKVTVNATSKSGQASSKKVVNVPDTSARDVKNMKASHVTDISVKSTSNKKDCWISGMAVVADNKVVAADWNNKTIKLIDTTSATLLSEHTTKKSPWDVTTCKDYVAATLPAASKIVFLKHTSGLVHDREISVNGDCRGIDSYDDKFYVVFDEQKKLEVITQAGVVLQTFSTTPGGQQIFNHPVYVTVNFVNKRIHVSEWNTGHVVVLDMAGNQMGRHGDDELSKQIAIDGTGVMFLCGYRKNKVHILSPSWEYVKILLTSIDGVVKPYALCYCETNGRLYVGMYGCDIIKVYKLS